MAPLHRGVLRHTVSPSPIGPRRVPLAQVERDGGGRRNGHRRTVYLPWRLFMLADGHLCCTHIALRSRSRGLTAPLLSPWPGHRRVMANALRIKCIFSLTARWHRYFDASAISRLRHSPPALPPCPSFRLDTSSFLVVAANFDCHFLRMREYFVMRPSLQLKPDTVLYSFFTSNRDDLIGKLTEVDEGATEITVHRFRSIVSDTALHPLISMLQY